MPRHGFHDFLYFIRFFAYRPRHGENSMIVLVVIMQNFNTNSYINNNKIINIKSEVLFREAQDDFFYFNKINTALKKLKEAVSLTPNHHKSLVLLADIYFMKGYIKKALNLYKTAFKITPSNPKVIASVANCLYSLGFLNEAIRYCDKAICCLTPDDYSLFSQIFDMKLNILLAQRKYFTAFNELSSAKNILDYSSLKNYEMLYEKINKRKKLNRLHFQLIKAGNNR